MATAAQQLQLALDELAKVRVRSGSTNLSNAKALIRADRDRHLAAEAPPEPAPQPGVLFRETFETSPAPTDYGDTPIWTNDGERLSVSGGVGHAAVNKVRLWTHEFFSGNIQLSASVTPESWRSGVPTTWGGFKFYLRREGDFTESSFYTAEPMIYDGSIRMQKKVKGDHMDLPGALSFANNGTYFLVAEKKDAGLALGGKHQFAAKAVTNSDGSVTLILYRDGVELLRGVDRGIGGAAPFTNDGPVGWRSDYLNYSIDDYTVASI